VGVEVENSFTPLSVLLVERPNTLGLTCGARGEPFCSLVEHPTFPLGQGIRTWGSHIV
jgi:hypothetical protein